MGIEDDDDFSEPGLVNIKPGEEWLVVTCRSCQRALLIEPVSPEMIGEDGEIALPEGNLEVKCPYCGAVHVYQSDEIRVETGRVKH